MPASPTDQLSRATRYRAVLCLLGNSALWGFSWIIFQNLTQNGLHSLWATAVTGFVCAVILIIKYPKTLPIFFTQPRLYGLAVAAGVTNTAFSWGISIGPVVRVVLLFYLMPIWTLLLGRFFFKHPITVSAVFRIGLALLGAMIMLAPPVGNASTTSSTAISFADFLGIISGIAFAFTSLLLKHTHQLTLYPYQSRSLSMFMGNFMIGSVAAGLLSQLEAIAPFPSLSGSLVMGLLILTTGAFIANIALQYGATRLPVVTTSLIMMTEIIFATGSALLFGNETFRPYTAIGGALILLAGLLGQLQLTSENENTRQ